MTSFATNQFEKIQLNLSFGLNKMRAYGVRP